MRFADKIAVESVADGEEMLLLRGHPAFPKGRYDECGVDKLVQLC